MSMDLSSPSSSLRGYVSCEEEKQEEISSEQLANTPDRSAIASDQTRDVEIINQEIPAKDKKESAKNVVNENDDQTSELPRVQQIQVRDSYTLPNPSSTVKFENNRDTFIFCDGTKQIVIQKKDTEDDTYYAKQYDEGTFSLLFVRLGYATIATFMAGFLFAFCIQVLLYLFLGVLTQSGLMQKQKFAIGGFFGTILATPLLVLGMANAMTIAIAFVMDTFNGQRFMKTFYKWSSVLIEWVTFAVFIGIPLMVGCISLYAGSENWYEITLLTSIICVFVYYLVFLFLSIASEIRGAFELLQHNTESDNDGDNDTILSMLKCIILMKQMQRLSGHKMAVHTIESKNGNLESPKTVQDLPEGVKATKGLWASLTKVFVWIGFYSENDDANQERVWALEEVIENSPFVTRQSWGLEKVFCRNRKLRSAAIVTSTQNDSHIGLGENQMNSSFAYLFVVLGLTLLALFAGLAWIQASVASYFIACFVYLVVMSKQILGAYRLHKHVRKTKEYTAETTEVALFHVHDYFIWTKPKPWLCWLELSAEFVFLFILPVSTLFITKNIGVGIVYIIVALITSIRTYFNVRTCLLEFGPLDRHFRRDTEKNWRRKHSIAQVMKEVGTGFKSQFWTAVLGVFIVIFCILFVGVVATSFGVEPDEPALKVAVDVEYPGVEGFRYASCEIQNTFNITSQNGISLVDAAFLSSIAYEKNESVQSSITRWFQGALVKDHENDYLKDFKEWYGGDNVVYKFIGFPDLDLGVVTIRGTSSALDTLADAQLWSGAMLLQAVRTMLPFGHRFTPALEYLNYAMSFLETGNIRDKAFYQETTAFVKNITEQNIYSKLFLTGHCKFLNNKR